MRVLSTFVAAVSLTSLAFADEPPNSAALLTQLKDKPLQRQLICTGFLDAEIGRATEAQLLKAVERLRAANGLAGGHTEPLSKADTDLLAKTEGELSKLVKLEKFTFQATPEHLLTMMFPTGLADVPQTSDITGWLSLDQPKKRISIDLFRRYLGSDTASSLFSGSLARFSQISFSQLSNAADEFIAEGVANYGGARYYFHHRAFEYKGALHGLFLKFNTAPPQDFQVPEFLAKTIAEPGLRKDITKLFDARQIADPEELPPDDRNIAWVVLDRIVTKLVISDFNTLNGWQEVNTSTCDREQPVSADSRIVRIIFGTNRRPMDLYAPTDVASLDTTALFGSEAADKLYIGCAEVSVPKGRLAKKLYTPFDVSFLGTRTPIAPDPAKHLIAKRILPIKDVPAADQRYLRLTSGGEQGTSTRALLIVHGFNNSFSDALLRAAQIASDSGYADRTYLFSWPSKSRLSDYTVDMDSAEASEQALQAFLRAIINDNNVMTLDIIAHSMGSHQLLRALGNLQSVFDRRAGGEKGGRLRLGQVIFAAPDVSSAIFAGKVAQLAPFARRVTVYVSTADVPLRVSRDFHGGVQRAGGHWANEDPVLVQSANTYVVDISPEPTPWVRLATKAAEYVTLHHADFADTDRVILDIQKVLSKSSVWNSPCDRDAAFVRKPYTTDPKRYYWMLPFDFNSTTPPAAAALPCATSGASKVLPP